MELGENPVLDPSKSFKDTLVGKQNAENLARGALFNLEYEYQHKADEFRKSIWTEVERLLGKDSRGRS